MYWQLWNNYFDTEETVISWWFSGKFWIVFFLWFLSGFMGIRLWWRSEIIPSCESDIESKISISSCVCVLRFDRVDWSFKCHCCNCWSWWLAEPSYNNYILAFRNTCMHLSLFLNTSHTVWKPLEYILYNFLYGGTKSSSNHNSLCKLIFTRPKSGNAELPLFFLPSTKGTLWLHRLQLYEI